MFVFYLHKQLFFYICKNVFILITAFQFFNLKQSILMKIYLSTLLSLLLPLGFMACSSDDEPGKTPDVPAPQIQLTEIERTGVSSFNNFGLSLLGTIADDTRYGDNKNVSISPVSAAFVMAMIAAGCDASNADAISQAMGCTDPKQMAALSAKLLGHFAKPRSMQLMTANAMWYIDRYKLNSDYVSTLKQDFASHIVPVSDFSQSTVNDINSWISEMTKGNIPEFITSIDADQPALWINTLYAKGKWKLKFPKKRTNREIFHGTKGDIEVDMMHQTDIFNYKALENCEVIEMKFQKDEGSVIFILPHRQAGISDALSDIISAGSNSLINSFWRHPKVTLSMPRFKSKNDINLHNYSNILGLPQSISLAPMGINRSMQLLIRQSVSIDIDEDGAEAAVVTGNVGLTSPGIVDAVTMVFDRPFIYMMIDRSSQSVLTCGIIRNI